MLPAPSTPAPQTKTAKHNLRLESPLFILVFLVFVEEFPTCVCAIPFRFGQRPQFFHFFLLPGEQSYIEVLHTL
jgi:hypothetical protein